LVWSSQAGECKDATLTLAVKFVLSASNSSGILEINQGLWIHLACLDKLVELVLKSKLFSLDPVVVSESEDDNPTGFSGFYVVLESFVGEVALHVDSRAYNTVVLAVEFLRELLNALA
jgi:hypothetical protein